MWVVVRGEKCCTAPLNPQLTPLIHPGCVTRLQSHDQFRVAMTTLGGGIEALWGGGTRLDGREEGSCLQWDVTERLHVELRCCVCSHQTLGKYQTQKHPGPDGAWTDGSEPAPEEPPGSSGPEAGNIRKQKVRWWIQAGLYLHHLALQKHQDPLWDPTSNLCYSFLNPWSGSLEPEH